MSGVQAPSFPQNYGNMGFGQPMQNQNFNHQFNPQAFPHQAFPNQAFPNLPYPGSVYSNPMGGFGFPNPQAQAEIQRVLDENTYKDQLKELELMGFKDKARNLEVLR
jgi:hypothetical protein